MTKEIEEILKNSKTIAMVGVSSLKKKEDPKNLKRKLKKAERGRKAEGSGKETDGNGSRQNEAACDMRSSSFAAFRSLSCSGFIDSALSI